MLGDAPGVYLYLYVPLCIGDVCGCGEMCALVYICAFMCWEVCLGAPWCCGDVGAGALECVRWWCGCGEFPLSLKTMTTYPYQYAPMPATHTALPGIDEPLTTAQTTTQTSESNPTTNIAMNVSNLIESKEL